MDYNKQKKFFTQAYDLGEKRLDSKYGWPLEVDPQVAVFGEKIKRDVSTGSVLDLGCGQGRHTFYFAEQGYDAYGVDYIERAIREAVVEAAKRNLPNAHFQMMDLLAISFPKDMFDIVVDWSVLDHVHPGEWELYLKNILNVLKIGGYLMLAEFSADDPRILDKSKNSYFDRDAYAHYFRKNELETIFSKNFEFVEMVNTELGTPPPHVMVNVLLKRKV